VLRPPKATRTNLLTLEVCADEGIARGLSVRAIIERGP
jgi:hypothetical protein